MRICVANGTRGPKWITADVIDQSDVGLGISLAAPLTVGGDIKVSGRYQGSSQAASPRIARVAWCLEKMDGTYRAGLAFDGLLDDEAAPSRDSSGADERTDLDEDYYEVLQVSPAAEPETIHRIYKLLAQRYHPDNPDTGSADRFRLVLQAYRTLKDPEQRASYDARRVTLQRRRWRLFGQNGGSEETTTESEQKKRLGILNLLHRKRMHEPEHAAMSIFELEDLLGCPRDHLQFSLWYLKEKELISRTDRGQFSITVIGVDAVELQQERKPDSGRTHLAIEAPAPSPAIKIKSSRPKVS